MLFDFLFAYSISEYTDQSIESKAVYEIAGNCSCNLYNYSISSKDVDYI